ncbi:MAG: signal recognition particle-docking protein FtsY [Cyanobacteria bacterium SBC]|nr:signal recognition particle-docking protein FtsY [Cyanobacteria bacterium SBC]
MVFNWFRRQFDRDDQEKQETQTPVEEQPENAVEETEETPASEEASAAAPPSEDYLAWAKAAYQNIQKQQPSIESEADVEEATAEEAVVEEPVTEESVAEVEEPVAELPTTEVRESVVEEPVVEEPAAEVEESVVEESAAEVEELAVEEPVAETSVIEEPIAELPEIEVEELAVEEPVAETSVIEEPIAELPEIEVEESVVEEPVTESPAVEVEEPAVEEPVETETNIPAWAKATEERKERLERLKAAAVETPIEEEQQPQSTPDIEFDENFVWSAEVLAAQGRRPDEVSIEEINWLQKLRLGLGKTRLGLINQLKAIVGQGPLNKDAVMEIEALLLQADVGVEATDNIIETLQQKLLEETLPPDAAIAYLKQVLQESLERPFDNGYVTEFVPEKGKLNIWLMTGVNGAGKTTTIGKLAHMANKSEYRCLIAAADTFRAAAVEQVKIWGERSETEVIANPGKNTDPAAVVYDAISAAQSRNADLLLVDTAGRLQNKKNLMDELSKIRRIIDKKAPDAQVESLLVLDATLGQNGLRQAEVFAEAAKLSGVVLTKLDGTAKGGVALGVVGQLGLPIRFIGAGEGIEDLRPFSSYEFVEALLNG